MEAIQTEDLLALKGKIQIDYDWEAEEEKELREHRLGVS